MPYPDLNLQFPAIGSGVLAQPLVNPIQNPIGADFEAANAAERIKANKLQQQILKAQVLKEQKPFAGGAGPFGIRQGQGPMGWAVSLGDAIAGMIARKRQDEATGKVTGGMGELAPAENLTNEAINRARRQFVSQGSQLSSNLDPLGLK